MIMWLEIYGGIGLALGGFIIGTAFLDESKPLAVPPNVPRPLGIFSVAMAALALCGFFVLFWPAFLLRRTAAWALTWLNS